MAHVSLMVIMSVNVDQTQNAYIDFRGCRGNTIEYTCYIPELKVYPQTLFNLHGQNPATSFLNPPT
jgi:hypothetical protein